MPITLEDVQAEQLPEILDINNRALPHVNHLTLEDLTRLWEMSCYCRIAIKAGSPAGFLLAMTADTPYESENFRWFRKHHDSFVYIDRVVVKPEFRGLGVGKVFYADIESFSETRAPVLACEVNLEPRNDASLLFHGAFGFNEVGQHVYNGKRVSLMVKQLTDYEFIRSNQSRQTDTSAAG